MMRPTVNPKVIERPVGTQKGALGHPGTDHRLRSFTGETYQSTTVMELPITFVQTIFH